MSTEEGEAGAACAEARGDTGVTHRHTWEEGEPHGSQGRVHPGDEDEAGQGEQDDEDEEGGESRREGRSCRDACGGNGDNNGGNYSSEDGAAGGSSCKTPAMNSNCSSETCIPTPSCRICFQGAEQVNARARLLPNVACLN